ncbi:BASS family bile acid:Na+ symporter [Bradyrhizobium sp. USDA 4516]
MTTGPRNLARFARLVPSGPTLLIIGVLAGLAFPALADGVRPLMTAAIFVLVLGTFLQVDGTAFRRALRRPLVWLLLPALAMLASPLAVGFAARGAGFRPELIVALVLSACAPPSSGTAAVARMLGFDATIPLAVTLLSMALAPVTVPLIAAGFADLAIDPLALATRLALLVGGAGALALLLRRQAAARLVQHARIIDALVLASLLLFAIATMAGVRTQIEAQPAAAFTCVGLAFGCNLALQLCGALLTPGNLAARLTSGLIVGNRNVGLVWSAMGAAVSPMTALFFAATQFPIYMTPRLIEMLVRRECKENASP